MGTTCGMLGTRIDNSSLINHLQEKEQLLVLLSRTHHLRDIYFVGGVEAVLATVREVMGMPNGWSVYMTKLVDKLLQLQQGTAPARINSCLLYTSDAADE